jgi:L-rhamnose mutarotase
MNEDLIEFNSRLSGYYKQLNDTWNESQKEYDKKVPELPKDTENIEASKRIWIDIFENYFTRLFDSSDFSENFGKLVTSELEIAKHWNNMASTLLESANMPTKKEMDEVYKELHSLRKRVAKLEKIANKGGN